MAVTPSGTGGRPAAVHSSSPHASTWFSISRCPSTTCGVHEARISIWALPESSAIAPKLSVATRVTVPEAEAYVAPCAAERLGEPRPADVGQGRVGDHLEVDLGAGVADAAERAVPRVVAGRVVEQDQAAGADVDAVDGHVGAQRGGVRRDPLRRRHRLAEHLGAHPGLAHGAHRLLELRRARRRTRSGARLRTDDHDLTVGRPSSGGCANTPGDLRRFGHDRHPARQRLPPGCPGRAGRPHAGVVHAPGRALAAGVPQAPRGRRDARVVHGSRR